jgi:hypothetical protein
MGEPLGSPVKGSVKAPAQSSRGNNYALDSGSRPGTTKMPIKSSAPMDPKTLDRHPPAGALGSGNEKARG